MLTARGCWRCVRLLLMQVHPFARTSEDAEHFGGAVAGAAEPVRHLGVELGCLADTEDQILVTQHEPHPAREDVEPLEALVGARVRLVLTVGMTIFHAWMPPGRVRGRTVRPWTRRGFSRMRGSPTSGAPTRSSIGTG